MSQLTVYTYDWVPEGPRGHVRDIRICWALEEAGLPFRVRSTPFKERGAAHLSHQAFGQVPWLEDGDLSIFESGAILLYLGERSDKLMPKDVRARAKVTGWVFGALNSVEMVSVCWSVFKFSKLDKDTPEWKILDDFLQKRLDRLEPVLAPLQAKGGWLAGDFSIADILMADVLRLMNRFERLNGHPACRDYVARATARPAFKKALADQMAHFAAADPQK